MSAALTVRLSSYLDSAAPFLSRFVTDREADHVRRDRQYTALTPQLASLIKILRPQIQSARRSGVYANPWRIAGLKDQEVRTAAVLAWFLDPTGDHGAGDAFARAFWAHAGGEDIFGLGQLHRVVTEMTPLDDAGNRVDIVLEGADCLIFVEVKINAPLRRDQLEDYHISLNKRADHYGLRDRQLVFLSNGDAPEGYDGLALDWPTVAGAMRRACRELYDAPYVTRLACDFADHIERY